MFKRRPDLVATIEELRKACITKGIDPITAIKWNRTKDEEDLIQALSMRPPITPELLTHMFQDRKIATRAYVQMLVFDLKLMKEHGVRIRFYSKMDTSCLGDKFEATVKNASYPPVYDTNENGEGVVFMGVRIEDIVDEFYETLQNTTETTTMTIADAQRWFACAFSQYDVRRVKLLHPLIQLYDENTDKPWANLAKILIRVIFMSIGEEDKSSLWMVNHKALESKDRFLNT